MLNAFNAITLNNEIYYCLNSNEDIDTDQLPQQLMQGELEGYERFFFSLFSLQELQLLFEIKCLS